MYPATFDYYQASSVAEAISLLNQHADAKLLAGGHSLLPVMKLRLATPSVLVDIGRISDLKGITAMAGGYHIGALTTHSTVAASADLPDMLAEAAAGIGDPQVRNRGTVGGNVAHADPASDLPTVFVALGATFHVAGRDGERSVAADDFFTGLFSTALADGEVVTGVSVPGRAAGTGSAYAKFPNPASRYAMVGAGAVLTVADGVCTAARVAVGGLTPCATRAKSVEAALVGQALTAETITAAAAAVANDLGDDVLSDIHASAAYRRAMAPVYVKRALLKAAERC